jgi:hypothetical protein
MEIRHWDEDDEPEFLLITDSKSQATINCTAEAVREGGREGGRARGRGEKEGVFYRRRNLVRRIVNGAVDIAAIHP